MTLKKSQSSDPEADTLVLGLGSEIFGLAAGDAQAGWVRLLTDNPSIGSFFQFGNLDLTQLDGSNASGTQGRKFYFCRVFEGVTAFRGQAASTSLSIANPNDSAINLSLRLRGPQQNAPASAGLSAPTVELAPEAVRTIAGHGFLFESISDLFGDIEVSDGYVEAEVTEGVGAVGFELVQLLAQSTIIGLNASFGNPARNSFSAQLAETPSIFTNLRLVNVSDGTRQVTLTAVADGGSNLAAPVNMELAAGETLQADMGVVFGLNTDPAGVQIQSPSMTVGSLRVEADGPGLIGDVIFGDPTNFLFAASMPLQTDPFLEAVFSQVANGAGLFTGIALYNPNPADAEVTIQVFSAEGALTGEETLTLEAGTRISRLVPQFVPSSAGQLRGYIVIKSTLAIIAQQLFGEERLNMLSAVPPTKAQ